MMGLTVWFDYLKKKKINHNATKSEKKDPHVDETATNTAIDAMKM